MTSSRQSTYTLPLLLGCVPWCCCWLCWEFSTTDADTDKGDFSRRHYVCLLNGHRSGPVDIWKFKQMNGTPYQHIPVYRPPTDHLLTTYQPPTNHLPTTYRPPTNHLPTTYRPLTDHLLTTYRTSTDHLPTTFLWCSLFTITIVEQLEWLVLVHRDTDRVLVIAFGVEIWCTGITQGS